MIGIYKITSPSGRVYIGQSRNINYRFRQYKSGDCKSQPKLQNSFKKYGYENHILEILEECSLEDLNRRERWWQDYYFVLSYKGLNCKLTSTEEKIGEHSEETKEKIRNSLLGHSVSERTKQISSERNKGNKYCLGYKHTNEYLETRRKKILQYNRNNTLIKEWDSINEAAESIENNSLLKSRANSIGNCLRNITKTAYGFIWKFKNEI